MFCFVTKIFLIYMSFRPILRLLVRLSLNWFQFSNIYCFFIPIKVWFGVMFVQKGLYRGIVLRFNVMIGTNYPISQIPVCFTFNSNNYPKFNYFFNYYQKIFFDAIPFHPLIDPMSEIGRASCRERV